MKRKASWLMMLTVIVMLSLIVSACSGGGSINTGNSGSSDSSGSSGGNVNGSGEQAVKLRILWWGSQQRHDATMEALKLYTEQNPHVTFEPEFSGWDGYWDKLSTQSAAKNAPDIIQMDSAYLAEYASRNQLLDLSSGIDTSKMDQALVDTGKYQDKLYAISLGNNAFGMAYNKEAVEKLGLTPPQTGWTWEDYWAFGREAKAKIGDGGYVLMDMSRDIDVYGLYQMSKGKGYYVTDDGKFNMDWETWMEWITTIGELREEGVIPPADVQVTDKELDPNLDLLAKGTVLIRQLHAAQATALDNLNPGGMALVTMPRGDEGSGWLKSSMFWSVSANTQYEEESKKFIDWFINSEEANAILGTTRGVPVNNEVLAAMEPNMSEADKMGVELIRETAPIAQPFKTEPKGWPNFRNKDYRMIAEKIMYKQITPEQAWEEIVSKSKEYE
ncbi:ABC transporter substrate-binding protein [Paenibacillus abyssi]|uniref:ABC transporter substrate-binding protein n=2 Tax=Paenibacillus abyssi TaxID=1340531 RepID=A0A917CZ00_9BACL|nr:ABC transporter substrate-binding protein [Paenibacillus abyssi]